MNAFYKLWTGQLISSLGSGLTSFGVGVWVYQRTGSVTQFAMISLFSTLPGVLALAVAGPLVDRFNRSKVIVISDLVAGGATIIIPVLLLAHQLTLPFIYAIASILSICTSFRWPAYSAAIGGIVPRQALGRANGMVQLSDAAAEIVPPITAGFLMGIIGIHGLVLADFSTYIFAVAMTAMIVARTLAPASRLETKSSLYREALFGWKYLRSRPGLMSLLAYFAVINFLLGLVTVLATPMILSFTSVKTLGSILSFGGIGMLMGALLMSAWGGFRHHIDTVLLFGFLAGLGVGIVGFRPSPFVVAAGSFTFFFCIPIINAASQAIWQTTVESELQGRVFSIRRMIATISLPLAYLLAGPLVRQIFEPLIASGTSFARAAESLVGQGPGRGIGLLMVFIGLLIAVTTLLTFLQPRVRFLEQELAKAVSQAD